MAMTTSNSIKVKARGNAATRWHLCGTSAFMSPALKSRHARGTVRKSFASASFVYASEWHNIASI
jgi:hypothetical protein